MQIIRFPKELSELVLARGNELLEVDFDQDMEAFLEVAEPTLRFFIAEETKSRGLAAHGPNIVEVDIVENLAAFATYSVRKASAAMGYGSEAKLIFRSQSS